MGLELDRLGIGTSRRLSESAIMLDPSPNQTNEESLPMSQSSLTEEQVSQYVTDGYLVVPSVFDDEELQQVDQTISEMARQALESGRFEKVMELEPEQVSGRRVPRRIYNPFEQHERFRKLAVDDRILNRIELLIGPNIALQHSKLNMKPAKVGSIVEWHQDLAYFPHTNADLVTTLIYLDDATEENGCLQVLPRQHNHFFDHRLADGTFAGMIAETIDDGRFGPPVALAAPAGSVIFMHCITPHSSLPNVSDKPRRTLIFEYRAEDAFPIYFGDYVYEMERYTHHLRGEPSQVARFGGPPPVIPNISDNAQRKSLYTLQSEARAKNRP